MTAAVSPLASERKRGGKGYLDRRRRTGTLLLLPALAVLFLVLALPIATSVLLSLQSVDSGTGALFTDWVGLDNYIRLASDPVFAMALRNSVYYMVVEVAGVVAIGLGFALLLNHPLVARHSILRVVLLVPWALAPVANAVLWKWIYNSSYGILNFVLQQLGLIQRPIVWLGDASTALNSLLLAEIWKEIPFITLLLLAGLQNVPPILYRAARLDGAGAWQTFRYVTLPQLRSTILICVVLQSIWALKSFDLVYVLTRGGPANATVLLNFLAYRVTFQFGNIGFGAAVADILFLLMFTLALVYTRVFRPTAGARETRT
jgi:multiple sugar transport system permease protein